VSIFEMEAAAIFAVARVRGVRAALIVTVSDELFGHE
jgi:purine-nucleoside phosphorylase